MRDKKVKKVKKVLATGETVFYHYACAGGPRFWIGAKGDGAHTIGYDVARLAALAPPPAAQVVVIPQASAVVADMIAAWKRSEEWMQKADRTQADYERGLRDIEAEFGQEIAVDFLNDVGVGDIIKSWIETRGWRGKEGDVRLDAIKGLCSWLSERKGKSFPKSQLYGLKKFYTAPDRSDIVWTDKEVEKFRSTARAELGRAVVLARETSARISDLVKLGPEHIHDRSDGGKTLIYRPGKGKRHNRIVNIPLTKKATASVSETPEGQATFLVSADSVPWTSQNLSKETRRHATEIGIRKAVRFNDLRGSKATELIWSGHLSIAQLALHMGWSLQTAARMMTVYGSLNPDALSQGPSGQTESETETETAGVVSETEPAGAGEAIALRS